MISTKYKNIKQNKTIYLIRHGQTEYNARGMVQGSKVDASLNELGEKQSLAFYEKYKDVNFDKVYTSLLKRATESIRFFTQDGLLQEKFEGLNEISWGDSDGTLVSDKDSVYYKELTTNWAEGNTHIKVAGGESPDDVLNRQAPVIDLIMNREEEKNVLICIHGRAIRILLCYLTNQPLSQMDTFDHTNLGLYKLEWNGSKFEIENHNDVSHLQSL